ncbi:M20 family metallopeptidase [Catenovulum sp. SM1970]|uniref:M20 family metallopeptidase n=1 Tax=Marinifaba aquimaris TaxID=2741323 RepID=UPI001571F1DB|nr:M20 family metallopeptidase [Marinifaba aquimaris]NTS77024.1 M20 family metallopeptidase [Marinifaba aquimaris]
MSSQFDYSELQQIIELNSHTKNKAGVDENGHVFSNWMQDLGFEIKRYERVKIGDHLLFISNKTAGQKLLLLGHLDTVYPVNTFTQFHQDEHWIYGPGVCDMKGGNYVALSALRNVYQTLGGIANIDMLLVSDEETGSDDSRALTSELAPKYDACLVFEAAGKNGEVVIGRKGVGTFEIDLHGKAAHAGNHYIDGRNANLAAAHMLVSLTALTDLTKGTTVNVGQISGGIGANTISPKANLKVEIRYTKLEEKKRLLNRLNQIVCSASNWGVSAHLSGGIQRDVMQPNANQAALLQQLETIIGERLLTEKRGGVSDANITSAAGLPTIDGFGPFGDGDHTLDERACKASFVKRIEQVTKILAHYNAFQSKTVAERESAVVN